jgi:hypothetical protein
VIRRLQLLLVLAVGVTSVQSIFPQVQSCRKTGCPRGAYGGFVFVQCTDQKGGVIGICSTSSCVTNYSGTCTTTGATTTYYDSCKDVYINDNIECGSGGC